MVGEALSGISALKGLTDIFQRLLDARDDAIRSEVSAELTQRIMDLQMQMQSLIDSKEELKKRNMELEDWSLERARYSLKELQKGIWVFAAKDMDESGGPTHSLCPNCFENNEKSILQANTYTPGRASVLECHRCHSVLYLAGSPQKGHPNFK